MGLPLTGAVADAASNLVALSAVPPAFAGDCSSLEAVGSVDVEIGNEGPDDVAVAFEVLAFVDLDADGLYSPGIDRDLGLTSVSPPVLAGATMTVSFPVAGELLFRDGLVHVAVDSGEVEAESDETDNVVHTGQLCARPPVGAGFNVVVEWEWREDDVATAPLVGDVNADGTPDVVFAAISQVIHCLDGRTGNEIWRTNDVDHVPNGATTPALAELDGDPGLEVVSLSGDELAIWDDDGTFLRVSSGLRTPIGFPRAGAVTIADMDCDGSAEAIFQSGVIHTSDGTPYWTPASAAPGWATLGSNSGYSGIVTAADVDDDGLLEVLAGPTAWTLDPATGRGTGLWRNPDLTDGYSVPGQFDADPAPEVVIVMSGRVALVEGDTGATIWDVAMPFGGPTCVPPASGGGPPTIADFDGDGEPEIGIADAERYLLYEGDGSLKWEAPTSDCSSASTGSTVFDFDGDGAAEVVYQDEYNLHIFRGTDGFELARVPTSHGTIQEMPTVADVDGDGDFDILVTSIDGPARLYRNDVPTSGHWLRVRALLPAERRDAIGARITVHLGERALSRTIRSGSSYQSISELAAHFGLGAADAIDAVDVIWPNGDRERFPGGPANRELVLRQGQGGPPS